MEKINLDKTFEVNGKQYQIIKLLGHGKGGYSYLALYGDTYYVLKQIHHEPCSYYTFGNKIESEVNDYYKLLQTGINVPKMIEVDMTKEIVVKEYIEGPTVYELVRDDLMKDTYFKQVKEMAELAHNFNLNIDYYPTNFIVRNDILYYIDYECNTYMEKWNFMNWGIKYWSKTKEFLDTLE